MYGKILFTDVIELAKFLKEFTGSTAMFKVKKYDDSAYELEFTGGY